jgi:hypothetical protein
VSGLLVSLTLAVTVGSNQSCTNHWAVLTVTWSTHAGKLPRNSAVDTVGTFCDGSKEYDRLVRLVTYVKADSHIARDILGISIAGLFSFGIKQLKLLHDKSREYIVNAGKC